jgi:class 3 adenylate cyclase/tetratricopeptide (TPR) repeat protein
VTICTQCGRQNADGSRFCSDCGAQLSAEAIEARSVRKTVTILFCDMVASTTLGERLDPESLRRVLARWHESMRVALERHGGTVEKFVGDAVMAVFGLPVAHEDDALRAARAAVDMRTALDAINEELERDYGVEIRVRTAVNTGEVVAGNGETLVTGDAVNVAARLEQNARAGEIRLGEQTALLLGDMAIVEPVPEQKLKGKSAPVRAWRLLSVLPEVPAFMRPPATPFVGRRGELAAIQTSFELAVDHRRCEHITVLGPPGIGKSRLVREAVASLGSHPLIAVGRCLPYGEGITYWPLVEIVREIAGPDPRPRLLELFEPDENGEFVADAVAAAVGASEHGGATDETHWAIRMFLEALARDRPLVVVLEDLHWAEPTFLDLVEYVAGFSRECPILLVCSARPELLETRPAWTTLMLGPMSEPDIASLVDALLDERSPAELRANVLQVAEGNPLFVEQLVALQSENPERDGELAVPPSLHALLAARIDRLEPADRAIVERAAVEGRTFHRGAVAELLPSTERDNVGARLLGLVRKDLVHPDRTDFSGDDGFRFAHVLIRDAAYESTPKELRAELHERYADWLEEKAGDRVQEYAELLGYHLEQSSHYRRELVPGDSESVDLCRRAAAWLAAAARRARPRGDELAAAALFSRAVQLLPEDDLERMRLLPELGEVVTYKGDYAGAIAVLNEAVERSAAVGDRRTHSYGLLLRAEALLHSDPAFTGENALSETTDVLRVFEELSDERGQARAWAALAWHHLFRGRIDDALQAHERALEHALTAKERHLEIDARLSIGTCLFFGETPLEEAISYAERLLEQPDPIYLGRSLQGQLALAHAQRGDFATARELISDQAAVHESRGNPFAATFARANLGDVDMLAGDPMAAEGHFRRAYEALAEARETGFLSTMVLRLANAVCAQGRFAEAEQYTRIGEEASASDDYASQVLWRTARATAIANQDRFAEAEDLAREAVGLARETDDINQQANALSGLSTVLALADRRPEAVQVVEDALSLYERKGNLVEAQEARAFLDAGPSPSTA